jgi:glycosyltransferase involved in cell wall biosynthesis
MQSVDPEFSIILPTYDRPKLVGEAIASVQRQTFSDFELIVVDDAGTVPFRVGNDPRVRVLRLETNVGPAAARNAGLVLARGRSIAFLDDDDVFSHDRLELARRGLQRAPVTICWSRFMDEDGTKAGRTLEGNAANIILNAATPSLGATAISRSAVQRFDERWTAVEDVEWWLRVAQASSVATIPEFGYYVRRHAGPRNRNDLASRIRENLLFIDTHSRYLADHRRAAAFRWKRVGLLARRVGNLRQARSAFVRSLLLKPEAATAWHLMKASLANERNGQAAYSAGAVDQRS